MDPRDHPSPNAARGVESSVARPPAEAWGAVLQADEDAALPPSLADRDGLLAEVAQVVELVVTSVGQRMEEEAGDRLQSLLDGINSRLDDLGKEAKDVSMAESKPIRLTVPGTVTVNGKSNSELPNVKVVGMSVDQAGAELPARKNQPPSAAH